MRDTERGLESWGQEGESSFQSWILLPLGYTVGLQPSSTELRGYHHAARSPANHCLVQSYADTEHGALNPSSSNFPPSTQYHCHFVVLATRDGAPPASTAPTNIVVAAPVSDAQHSSK
ncbi:hypothetical protein VNO80_10900 [Phaseolus coccineus]|uniref:Uncharacterized protein n=1 Tax=Phaseolus coccineus TaxID=3886 RepID=A0AAN9RJW4_PHACN